MKLSKKKIHNEARGFNHNVRKEQVHSAYTRIIPVTLSCIIGKELCHLISV